MLTPEYVGKNDETKILERNIAWIVAFDTKCTNIF
jgi:hypothetical protein